MSGSDMRGPSHPHIAFAHAGYGSLLAQAGPVRVIVESVSSYALQYAGPLASRP